ncbi:MAG: hypothetical protein NVSMB64_29900 [Candidatus Velthaea sp.]
MASSAQVAAVEMVRRTEPAYKLLGFLVTIAKDRAAESHELRRTIGTDKTLSVKEQQALASQAMQASMDATDALAKCAELTWNVLSYALQAPCEFDAAPDAPEVT